MNFGLLCRVLRSQSSALLGNTSVLVKSFCVATALLHWLSYWEAAVDALSLTPGYFLPPHFRVWTLFTHCFLETRLWLTVADVVALLLVGKLVEPLWGAAEMAVFYFATNVGAALLSALFYYVLYALTFNAGSLFDVRIHGLAAYLAGVSVATKQIMPDHALFRSPLGKITNRNVPLVLFLSTFVLRAIGLVDGSYCTMFGSGLLVSWIYLRFYQVHSNGTRGDMAESFGFPSFFPNVVQPPLTALCNGIFSVLVRFKVCKRPIRKYDVGSANSISISLPGAESHDTERRRQIALKALSERLSKADASTSESAWPSLKPAEENAEVHVPVSEVSKAEVEAPSETDTLIRVEEEEGEKKDSSLHEV